MRLRLAAGAGLYAALVAATQLYRLRRPWTYEDRFLLAAYGLTLALGLFTTVGLLRRHLFGWAGGLVGGLYGGWQLWPLLPAVWYGSGFLRGGDPDVRYHPQLWAQTAWLASGLLALVVAGLCCAAATSWLGELRRPRFRRSRATA